MRYFPRRVAKPLDHVFDGGKEFLLFLLWVRIVIAQVAHAIVDTRIAKIKVDCLFCESHIVSKFNFIHLGMANVQNSIWLGRETSAHLAAGYRQMLVHMCHCRVGCDIARIFKYK